MWKMVMLLLARCPGNADEESHMRRNLSHEEVRAASLVCPTWSGHVFHRHISVLYWKPSIPVLMWRKQWRVGGGGGGQEDGLIWWPSLWARRVTWGEVRQRSHGRTCVKTVLATLWDRVLETFRFVAQGIMHGSWWKKKKPDIFRWLEYIFMWILDMDIFNHGSAVMCGCRVW